MVKAKNSSIPEFSVVLSLPLSDKELFRLVSKLVRHAEVDVVSPSILNIRCADNIKKRDVENLLNANVKGYELIPPVDTKPHIDVNLAKVLMDRIALRVYILKTLSSGALTYKELRDAVTVMGVKPKYSSLYLLLQSMKYRKFIRETQNGGIRRYELADRGRASLAGALSFIAEIYRRFVEGEH